MQIESTGTSEHDLRDQTKCQQASEFSRIVFFHSITALYLQNGEYNSI